MTALETSYILMAEASEHSFRLAHLPPIMIDGRVWQTVENVSLGGYFYDHICDADGLVVGIRYWSDGSSLLESHILRRFLEDRRFFFDKRGLFVDILFELTNVDQFIWGSFVIDTVQDFGGEYAVSSGDLSGIVISV